ncbi:MAG TPA: NAD(P)H-dependent oxidoreductase subunit E [Firmicutes bacterium]|jgi:NADH:ubiquinone oxidoreductase subunit E|nr:NAD(P)H-dependent oxidoreductase subunit E [Bacillota bacterium]
MSRQLSDVEDVLQNALNKHGLSVVPLLQEIQEHFRYLPEEVLRMLSRKTGIPLIEIYHAATFYNSLSLTPRARHQIKICAGTTCHIRGGGKLIEEIFQVLGIRPGEITPNGEFMLETVNCLGCCAFAPAMVVDGKYYGNLTPGEVRKILSKLRERAALMEK